MISTEGDTDIDDFTKIERVGTNATPSSLSVKEDYTCDKSHTQLDVNVRLLPKLSTGKLMYNPVQVVSFPNCETYQFHWQAWNVQQLLEKTFLITLDL